MTTPTPQAARKQRAREYLEAIGFYRTWMDGSQRFDMDRPMYLLKKLLASTERAVLEEAAKHVEHVISCMQSAGSYQNQDLQEMIIWLRQQAQERTP